MKSKLISLWYEVRSSFWFIPAIMVLLSIGLSFAMVQIDAYFQKTSNIELWWYYTGGVEGARLVVSTIASALATIAGVVFSITLVAVSLTTSQYGPRLVWNLMNNKANQAVLGTFVASFVYCLLLLGKIGDVTHDILVPHLAVSMAILLSLLSLGALVYFVHHISSSIQANRIAALVYVDLQDTIESTYPRRVGEPEEPQLRRSGAELPEDFDDHTAQITSRRSGYIQHIDFAGLMKIAERDDLLIHVKYRPGHFIARGSVLMSAWPEERVDDDLSSEIDALMVLGNQRTLGQDVEFSVNQLVELAVRALSPGINDPFTAMACIDWLGVALGDLAGRDMGSPYHYDGKDQLRIVSNPITFSGALDAAFNLIRQYGRSSASVTIRLLEALEVIAGRVRKDQDCTAVIHQALKIRRGIEKSTMERLDIKDIEIQYQSVMKTLWEASGKLSGKRHLHEGGEGGEGRPMVRAKDGPQEVEGLDDGKKEA